MNPSTISTTHIEDLPPEMISELFEHLHPKDLATCSMVNRRWYSIHAAFKLYSLVVIEFTFYNFGPIKWYHSNRRVEEAERCLKAMFLRLVKKPLLSNLKQLVLCGYNFKEFDLNDLNRFRHLVHLEIEHIHLTGEVHLNLPRLKILAILVFNEKYALSIDCPELSTLLYYGERENVNLLKVKHPETIKRLETCMVGAKLVQFKSVECMIAREFRAISKATLLSLPRLKELRYDGDIEELVRYEFGNEVGRVDRMKRKLSEFLGEAKLLKGSDFQFTFSGFQLTNVNIDQIDFGVQVYEENEELRFEIVLREYIYLKNYSLIEPDALYYVRNAYYACLLDVTGEIPRCFSQKFTGIETVEVNGLVKDPDQLVWFLKSLRFLRTLVLKDVELSQEFYDQLPDAGRSLVSLKLEAREPKNELQLNFDYIGKLSSLFYLEINQSLSFESATSLVRWLGRLEEGRFNVQSREVSGLILKQGGDKWSLYNEGGKRTTEFGNPEEIVNFFNGLQNTQKIQQLTSQTSQSPLSIS